jgi:hypothetical protein
MKNDVTKFLLKNICQIFKKTSPQFITNCITKVWDSFVPVFFTDLNTYIHKCNILIFSSLVPLPGLFPLYIYIMLNLNGMRANDVTSENCRRKTPGQAEQKPNRKFVRKL